MSGKELVADDQIVDDDRISLSENEAREPDAKIQIACDVDQLLSGES